MGLAPGLDEPIQNLHHLLRPETRARDCGQTQQPATPHREFGTYARAIGERGAKPVEGRTSTASDLKHEGDSQGGLVREKDFMNQKLCLHRDTR